MSSAGRKALVFVLAAAVIAIVVTGCGNSSVATVNGRKISRQEYCSALEQLPFYQEPRMESGLWVLDRLVRDQLVLSLADKEKCRPTDAQVNERLAQMEKLPTYMAWGDYLDYARQYALTKDQIKEQVRVFQAEFNLWTRGISIPEKDLRASYEQNKLVLYTDAETAEVAMIMCKTQADADKAMELLKTVEFATVAKRLSVEPNSAANGGRIGKIYRDQQGWDKTALKKIFATKKGEITGPVLVSNESVKAVLIFKVIRINPAKTRKYEEVKYVIQDRMMREQGEQKWDVQKELVKFSETAKIKINIDRYKDKLTPPKQPAQGQTAPQKAPEAPK